jgi:hypothetical protein
MIFYSAESVHHTSMGTRFLRTPIADCCIDQGLQNRRAPAANTALGHRRVWQSDGNGGCPVLHDLPIRGRWFHIRISSNNGLVPDIAACLKGATTVEQHCGWSPDFIGQQLPGGRLSFNCRMPVSFWSW